MSKKILLINYYWPPSGGPAVQRWLSLTSELAKLGWSIWVITVDEKYATYQMYDESLIEKIHPSIRVIKTKTIEPFGLYKVLFGKKSIPAPGFSNEASPSPIKKISRFIRGNFFIPDPRKYWKSFAVKQAQSVIEQEEIKIVITAGPPHSTHFIGKSLKEKYPLNWICDFHDLWTDVIYYRLLYHLPVVKKKDRVLERKILESCDYILTVGEKYKQKLLSKSHHITNNKIWLIRIGYDKKLFQRPVTSPDDFVIAYVGSIAEYYEPEVFFEVIQQVINQQKDAKIKIRFVGVASPLIRQLVHKYKLQNIYQEDGYVSHFEAVLAMQHASALLLINPVTKDESMVIPGKIYEYLASRKPIINITKKDSETASLIDNCKAGKTFERKDFTSIKDYITELYLRWEKDKQYLYNKDMSVIEKFSRESIGQELNEHLSSLL